MQCLICAHATHLWINPQTNVAYYYCPSCECVFRDPETLLSADEEKQRYEQHNNSLEEPGYVLMFERFIEEAVAPYVPKGERILDFGAGPASPPVLATLLDRHGYPCDVYDPFFHPDVTYEDGVYDAVVATEVFEHLSDPVAVFQHLLRVCRDDGRLLFMTNFHPNDQDSFMKWWYWRDETHVVFYTPKTFEVLAAQNGCGVIYHNDKNVCVIQKRML